MCIRDRKNTEDQAGQLVTTADLDTGMYDWRQLLTLLPHDVPIALEYPMETDAAITQQLQLLRAEVGD